MGTWTPEDSVLATVREFDNFSTNITYYSEEETPAGTVRIDYLVEITENSPQNTVSVVDGVSASISGYYRYIFYDTIIYLDFADTVKTITGSATKGTWELFDVNDCYQMIEFIPDDTRYRRFEFVANAKGTNGETIATKTYYVDVNDQSWTPGLNALLNVIQTIKTRGN